MKLKIFNILGEAQEYSVNNSTNTIMTVWRLCSHLNKVQDESNNYNSLLFIYALIDCVVQCKVIIILFAFKTMYTLSDFSGFSDSTNFAYICNVGSMNYDAQNVRNTTINTV